MSGGGWRPGGPPGGPEQPDPDKHGRSAHPAQEPTPAPRNASGPKPPNVRLTLTLNRPEYDLNQLVEVFGALQMLHSSACRIYGLQDAAPLARVRSGSLWLELTEAAVSGLRQPMTLTGLGVVGLYKILAGETLPKVLTLRDRVHAQRAEARLRVHRAEQESLKITQERSRLADNVGGEQTLQPLHLRPGLDLDPSPRLEREGPSYGFF